MKICPFCADEIQEAAIVSGLSLAWFLSSRPGLAPLSS